jgi:hypothetical protein
MTNADKYPQYVKDILNQDILQREKDDPVRIAYDAAKELHDGQTRKGIEKQEQITHPLQVYNLVNRCGGRNMPEREIVLAASLLHDGIEDYRKEEVESGKIDAHIARAEAAGKIMEAFPDKLFAEKVLAVVSELTNPVEFKNASGEDISKSQWQVENIKSASSQAKLIKICDKTINIMSNIEEVPDWDYDKVKEYSDKATLVVKSARENIAENDSYYNAVKRAADIYKHVYEAKMELLDDMRKDGREIPSKYPMVSISLKTIENIIDRKNMAGNRVCSL